MDDIVNFSPLFFWGGVKICSSGGSADISELHQIWNQRTQRTLLWIRSITLLSFEMGLRRLGSNGWDRKSTPNFALLISC